MILSIRKIIKAHLATVCILIFNVKLKIKMLKIKILKFIFFQLNRLFLIFDI